MLIDGELAPGDIEVLRNCYDSKSRVGSLLHAYDRLCEREQRLIEALKSISTLIIDTSGNHSFNMSNLGEAIYTAEQALKRM